MMFKFLLIVVLLFLACGVATILIARLNRIAAQLGELRRDMTRNEERLRARMDAAKIAAQQNESQNASLNDEV